MRLSSKQKKFLIALFGTLLIFFWDYFQEVLIQASPTTLSLSQVSQNQLETAAVKKVIDGDTIELIDGRKVRYIGIDTPETKHPNQPDGCFGTQASEKNSSLVANKIVTMEKDVSETDKFGRLLRYVYVDEVMVNSLLVKEGYALTATYPPDIKYQDKFQADQDQAQENKLGLWSDICN